MSFCGPKIFSTHISNPNPISVGVNFPGQFCLKSLSNIHHFSVAQFTNVLIGKDPGPWPIQIRTKYRHLHFIGFFSFFWVKTSCYSSKQILANAVENYLQIPKGKKISEYSHSSEHSQLHSGRSSQTLRKEDFAAAASCFFLLREMGTFAILFCCSRIVCLLGIAVVA